jgi:hypothetical protein
MFVDCQCCVQSGFNICAVEATTDGECKRVGVHEGEHDRSAETTQLPPYPECCSSAAASAAVRDVRGGS